MIVRTCLIAAAVAITTGIVLSTVGFALPFVIAVGLVAGGAVLLSLLVFPDDPRSDSPTIPAAPDSRATEVSRMAWALNPKTGLAGERVTRRVRGIVRHRLQTLGIDPDLPADVARRDAAIGPEVWSRLEGQGTTIADIVTALDAVDRLASTKEKQ
jgi:hypothetical protein